jgi:hypothetical protein
MFSLKRLAFIIFLSIVSFSGVCIAHSNAERQRMHRQAAGQNASAAQLDINRITLPLTATGGVYDRYHYSPSNWNGWGSNYESHFIFDQGLYIMGKRNGVVWGLPYLWWSPYSPGPVIDGRPAITARPQDSLRYRAYKITQGDTPATNRDMNEWPSDFGAPVDSAGDPRIFGDQTVWMVYNGLDTSLHPPFPWQSAPAMVPLEIHQTAFAHYGVSNDPALWANTVFMEWSIFNRSSDRLDSVYLSVWTDLDFVASLYNPPGVDTVTQTAYNWYAIDSSYAAVGYTLLYGPTVPSPGNTAIAFGKTKPGFRNLPMTSYWGIIDDSFGVNSFLGPPYTIGSGWNIIRGLNPNGTSIIDSTTKRPTRFPYSGDPITGTGSIYRLPYSGGGSGFMMTCGPLTLDPGDSVWMMAAILPSVKRGGIDAINGMRANAAYLRSLPYDSLIAHKAPRVVPPDSTIIPVVKIPSSFALHQNFPNPFNACTTIAFDLPVQSQVRLEVFDVLGRSVAVLADAMIEPGSRKVLWKPELPSGIYFYRLQAGGYIETKRLVLLR